MALINCPECGYLVSEKARACVNCGFPVYDELISQSRQKPDLRGVAVEDVSPPRLRRVGEERD